MNIVEVRENSEHLVEINLDMQSQIKDLYLHDHSVDIEQLGVDVSRAFKKHQLFLVCC